MFDATLKKKKKKAPAKLAEEPTAAPKKEEEATTTATATATAPAEEPKRKEEGEKQQQQPAVEADDMLGFGKKKKKKATTIAAPSAEPTAPAEPAPTATEKPAKGEEKPASTDAPGTKEEPWAGSDRDYQYVELLGRIFDMLRKQNPDFGTRQQTIFIKPPIVGREGKKTSWFNFAEIAKLLSRKQDHLSAFVFAELGTNGSVDGNQRLIIRGKYMPKHIETLIRKYIREYVVCNTCGQLHTVLKKENRLTFVVCTKCNSSRSVAAIKKGFEAQVTKRKHDS
jgi:translation initiation factor 2 subunit 2